MSVESGDERPAHAIPPAVPRHDVGLFSDRRADAIAYVMWLGAGLAVVGLVDGLYMALDRQAVPCPDGTEFPQGTTDFTCWVHPQAGIGIAVAVLSVIAGILVVMVGIVAADTVGRRTGGDAAAGGSAT